MRFLVLIVLLTGLTSSARAQLAPPPAALAPQIRVQLHSVPDEGTPDPGEHYATSNEWRHDLFRPHLRDIGGGFVGVGADPCYTLAAYQNASVVWLVDYDPLIPLLHRIYGVLIAASDSPDAFVERFAESEEAASIALIREAFADDAHVRMFTAGYRTNRTALHTYLQRVQRSRYATWLSEPALYERVRTLHRSGRVIARNADVTSDGALRAIGAVATELAVPIRVVYFSNAEEFFAYGREFRANINGFPSDARSVVLRTFRNRHAPTPDGDDWHYMVQSMRDFRVRVNERGTRRARRIVLDLLSTRRELDATGLSVVL